jgi:putative membrane protein insertion efficiency factor
VTTLNDNPVRRAAAFLITLYQRLLSPLFPPSCRFVPTCSQYAKEAILKHGIARGSYLAARRILRCHPFNPGGYDPVPER